MGGERNREKRRLKKAKQRQKENRKRGNCGRLTRTLGVLFRLLSLLRRPNRKGKDTTEMSYQNLGREDMDNFLQCPCGGHSLSERGEEHDGRGGGRGKIMMQKKKEIFPQYHLYFLEILSPGEPFSPSKASCRWGGDGRREGGLRKINNNE